MKPRPTAQCAPTRHIKQWGTARLGSNQLQPHQTEERTWGRGAIHTQAGAGVRRTFERTGSP